MNWKTMLSAAALALATPGCAGMLGGGGEEADATAVLRNAQGEQVGTVQLFRADEGVRLEVNATDLPPGTHAIHLHTVGRCEAPDFTSSGGHLNPTGRDHGFEDPQGPHMGDLRNIEVGAQGRVQTTLVNERAEWDAIFDEDGTAVVVHAGPDDYRTDPAGDAGPRIACGVINR